MLIIAINCRVEAQAGYVKPLQPHPVLSHECDYDVFERDECDTAKMKARADIQAGKLIYLMPAQFSYTKRSIIYAVILYNQFNIIPCLAVISCLRDYSSDFDGYDCYNDVMDSFYSVKYKINFRNVIIEKVDSMIDNTKPAELKKQYGYWNSWEK